MTKGQSHGRKPAGQRAEPTRKKKSVLDTAFFAGFIGAKAAGSTDEEALFIASVFDDEK